MSLNISCLRLLLFCCINLKVLRQLLIFAFLKQYIWAGWWLGKPAVADKHTEIFLCTEVKPKGKDDEPPPFLFFKLGEVKMLCFHRFFGFVLWSLEALTKLLHPFQSYPKWHSALCRPPSTLTFVTASVKWLKGFRKVLFVSKCRSQIGC